MNHLAHRGVMRMYCALESVPTDPEQNKERRAGVARGDEFVQEWILSAIGTESDAMERAEEARGASGVTEREWESLLRENAPLAYRVARGVLRNDADAEDVAQDALLRAYRRFGRLRERAKFRGWLVRISFRLALDRWMLENARADTGASSEFQRHLEVALEELPKKQRLVLLLAAMEGHTLEEVSTLLDIPLGTAKSRLFFAKKTLAEKLRCFVNPVGKR
jgi:RNA polymerase sigma-70 factor (ECF subfamily)